VFDTAVQDDFRCLVPLYARFAQVGVIVYDQLAQSSFDSFPNWINFLKSNSGGYHHRYHLRIPSSRPEIRPLL
jgi:GTPase SAR1 family protein